MDRATVGTELSADSVANPTESVRLDLSHCHKADVERAASCCPSDSALAEFALRIPIRRSGFGSAVHSVPADDCVFSVVALLNLSALHIVEIGWFAKAVNYILSESIIRYFTHIPSHVVIELLGL